MRKRFKLMVLAVGILYFIPAIQNNLNQVGTSGLLGILSLFLLIRFSRIKNSHLNLESTNLGSANAR